jgi:hypothetical protein
MFSMDLTTPECGSSAVVALRGDLDLADAATAATAAARLTAAAARDWVLIVDLAGLDFIDSSGIAALARGRAGRVILAASPGSGMAPERHACAAEPGRVWLGQRLLLCQDLRIARPVTEAVTCEDEPVRP